MKRWLIWCLVTLATAGCCAATAAELGSEKLRVLLFTGGHDFEQPQFYQIFKENPEITFTAVEHPKAHAYLRPELAAKFDVLVVYDMHQEISDQTKADLQQWFKSGKGMVSLHHSVANYQDWDEYERILGGRYYLSKKTVRGVEKARSIYQHGVQFSVSVVDPSHPVTKGLKDFEIHDETYNLFDVGPTAKPLLATKEKTSAPVIGWANQYEKGRIVYLQLGHDHFAYENPNYRKLIAQAIRWVAGND
jgi:type 1 glutamine amidotransferase